MIEEKIYPHSSFFGAWAKIYTLADENGNVFYVGCTTKRMELRLAGHISEAKTRTKYVNKRKVEHIRSLNYAIVAKIIDMKWVTYENTRYLTQMARDLEREWIKKFLELGYPLVNGRERSPRKEILASPEFIGKEIKFQPA